MPVAKRGRGRLAKTTAEARIKGVSIDKSKILAQEKKRKALELRKAGASYRMIAEQLGVYDASAARKLVISAYDEVIHEPAEEQWKLAIERLNYMLLMLWPKVQDPNHPDHFRAIQTAADLQVKLNTLTGIEAPKQVDVNVQGGLIVIDGNKDEYIAALARMAGEAPPELLPSKQEEDIIIVEAEEVEEATVLVESSYVNTDGGVPYIPLEEE